MLAREVVEPGTPGLSAVVQAFGSDVLAPDGTLDRKRLGRLVFGDTEARARLEKLLHPLIRALQQVRLAELAARGEPLACYEAPLLVEVGLAGELRPLVVVVAPQVAQVSRARSRDGLDERATEARLAAQLPLEEKRALADHVIDNAGSLDELYQSTDRVLDTICEKLGISPARYPKPPTRA